MVEHDNKVYNEDLEWKNSTIEILVRAMVKLSNMEDTTLLEDMRKVQDMVKKVLKNKTNGDDDAKKTEDGKTDVSEADGPHAGDAEEMLILRPKLKRRKKTKVEKLLCDETGILPKHLDRRSRRMKKPNHVETDAMMSSTMQPKVSASINLIKKEEQNSVSAVVNMLNTKTRQSTQKEFRMHAWAVYNVDE